MVQDEEIVNRSGSLNPDLSSSHFLSHNPDRRTQGGNQDLVTAREPLMISYKKI
jgi:hypothetical protein